MGSNTPFYVHYKNNCPLCDTFSDFMYKAKGAHMYVGGTEDIENMPLRDFIDCCYKNGINLGIKIVKDR